MMEDIEDDFLSFMEPRSNNLVLPGQKLRSADGVLRGHGTFESDGDLYASLCGVVEVVNKLVFVRPVGNSKYEPEVGDVVVGRISEVGSDRWLVDIRSHQRGQLQLASINLPGGEQRRRNAADQLDMRKFYQEGDVICLEVQRVSNDGGALLHARNARYGTLRNGCLVIVSPPLVRRLPHHMVTLQCGVHIVLGNNGMIWICTPPEVSKADTLNFVARSTADVIVSIGFRQKVARVRNCVLALGHRFIRISPDAIDFLYEKSEAEGLSVKSLLNQEIQIRLCEAYLLSL